MSAPPNVAQFQIPKDLNLRQDAETLVKLTGVASTSTQLTTDQLVAEVTPPATGVQTYLLPPLQQWKNQMCAFYCKTSAPGGETKFVYAEATSTDVVGDNISTTGDLFIGINVQGEYVLIVREVTT